MTSLLLLSALPFRSHFEETIFVVLQVWFNLAGLSPSTLAVSPNSVLGKLTGRLFYPSNRRWAGPVTSLSRRSPLLQIGRSLLHELVGFPLLLDSIVDLRFCGRSKLTPRTPLVVIGTVLTLCNCNFF